MYSTGCQPIAVAGIPSQRKVATVLSVHSLVTDTLTRGSKTNYRLP